MKDEKILYRYTINDGLRGGCVLATNEADGEKKVRQAYNEAYPNQSIDIITWEIVVWDDAENGDLVSNQDLQVVEVYQ